LYGTPGTLEILPLDTEELLPPIRLLLEDTDKPAIQPNSLFATDDVALSRVWYDRRSPLLHDGVFYIAEQQQFKSNPNMFLPAPEQDYWQSQWVLRSWNLRAGKTVEAPQRSIPGTPLAITKSGMLITQETGHSYEHIRLNLLALKADHAVLISDYHIQCNYSNVLKWVDDTLYVTCQTWTNTPNNINNISREVSTKIVQLHPTNTGFIEVGNWTFPALGVHLQDAKDGVILTSVNNYRTQYEGELLLAEPQSNCNVYQLIPEQEPILLKNLETCLYGNERVVLTPEQIWNVEGYAGIKSYKF
ncbi:MAG: hypothetical protein KAG43_08265, partial [Candidatus Marithrix sp.]|nr:hypothetical protein [Candidatus Marithrix sp.]